MADVTIWGIAAGAKATWAGTPLDTLVPSARLYLGTRAASGTIYPCATLQIEDGDKEYFSGSTYIAKAKVTVKIYGDRTLDWDAVGKYLAGIFGGTSGRPAGQWGIANAELKCAMPGEEVIEVLNEKDDGEDLIEYTRSFELTIQAERG